MSSRDAEVLIIGGGAAGLSAALTLTRARRRVIVLDNGQPRNAPAAAVHGLLGLDGIEPEELLRRGREEVASYGGEIVRAAASRADRAGDTFRIVTDTADDFAASTVLVATGVRDQLPAIPGLRQRWGREVVHCPYCHGWEIQDRRIGVLATGPMSALQAVMFRQWSAEVQFFPQGLQFSDADLTRLHQAGIPVIDHKVAGLQVEDDRLVGVHTGGSVVALDALVVPTAVTARLDGLTGFELATTTSPAGQVVHIDAAGHTSTPGVWAAGTLTNPAMQVSEAAAHGARVAMTINTELTLMPAASGPQEVGR